LDEGFNEVVLGFLAICPFGWGKKFSWVYLCLGCELRVMQSHMLKALATCWKPPRWGGGGDADRAPSCTSTLAFVVQQENRGNVSQDS
jgi:hypothetical protein